MEKKYTEGVGRRKTAVARVRFSTGKHAFTVNEKSLKDYFPTDILQSRAMAPLKELSITDAIVSAMVKGGGISAQADAIAHGLARALVTVDQTNKKTLRFAGLVTRDSRMVERKKYGLKKARRSPQWAKR